VNHLSFFDSQSQLGKSLMTSSISFAAFTIDAQKLARGGYSSSGLIPFPRTGRSAESVPATAAETADTDLIRNYFGQRQTGNFTVFWLFICITNDKCGS
jgi:hypothetical protein